MNQSTGQSTTGQSTANKDTDAIAVPAIVKEKYPEIVEMLLASTMKPEERDYWFQILPIMTAEQVERLKGILQDEAAQLKNLDSEYQEDLKKLNEKHAAEWNTFEKTQARIARQDQEKQNEKVESQAESQLLEELENIN